MTLLFIYCNDLAVIVLKLYNAATALLALIKVYSIPSHDRGHINVMLVLQSCTDSVSILPCSSRKTFPPSCDGACNFSNIDVEDDVYVKEESFIAINKEEDIGIKQEIPEDITFTDIKAEPNEVSYVYICLLLDTFYQCPEMSVVFVTSIFLAN